MARLHCQILSTQYGVSNRQNDLKLEAVAYDQTGAELGIKSCYAAESGALQLKRTGLDLVC